MAPAPGVVVIGIPKTTVGNGRLPVTTTTGARGVRTSGTTGCSGCTKKAAIQQSSASWYQLQSPLQLMTLRCSPAFALLTIGNSVPGPERTLAFLSTVTTTGKTTLCTVAC